MVEHTAHNGKNVGSNPTKLTIEVVKLVYTLGLGSNSSKWLGVQVPSSICWIKYIA